MAAAPGNERNEAEPADGPNATVRSLPWQGSDAELLARVSAGDARAEVLLFDRFAGSVNRMVWRLLGSDADHDDVVNDVFVRVIQGVRRVRDAEKLEAWVMRVTVNHVRSELRKRKLRRTLFERLRSESTEDEQVQPDHDGRRLLRRTFRLLAQLPDRQRIPFILRHVEQRRLEEVAQLCGCSLASVKRRLKQAEEQFRQLARREPEVWQRMTRTEKGGAS